MEGERLGPSEAEASNIASTLAVDGNSEASEPPKKKRRGPKGPNPLSVKKKQPKENHRRPRTDKQSENTMAKPQLSGQKRKRDGADGSKELDETSLAQPEPETVGKQRKRTRKRKRLAEPESRSGLGDGRQESSLNR